MSTQLAFPERHPCTHRARILRRQRGPELMALGLFVALLLAAEIALILRTAPFVDPLSLSYGGT